MIGLAILLAIAWAYIEADRINPGKGFKYTLFAIPILAGLITWNPLIGALVFVLFWAIRDPLSNLLYDYPFFYSEKASLKSEWKDLITGKYGLYDVINGRIALMFEVFIVIVLISEISIS